MSVTSELIFVISKERFVAPMKMFVTSGDVFASLEELYIISKERLVTPRKIFAT